MIQQELPVISEYARQIALTRVHTYLALNLVQYQRFAAYNMPNLRQWEDIWDRIAFAILTADTHVDHAVAAFHAMRRERNLPHRNHKFTGITHVRANYVIGLPRGPVCLTWKKKRGETWHTYRLRLQASIQGLGLTKASYAATLLYPLHADVACLDLWMQRLLRGKVNASPSLLFYTAMEEDVRRNYARPYGIGTGLAQWILWDFARTRQPTDQRFFD